MLVRQTVAVVVKKTVVVAAIVVAAVVLEAVAAVVAVDANLKQRSRMIYRREGLDL